MSKVSRKGGKMNQSKNTGKSMATGNRKEGVKKEFQKMTMEKANHSKTGMHGRRTLDSSETALIRFLRRMLPTDATSTTETA